MRALGGELVEHGDDFQAAYEYAAGLAAERKLHAVRSFHPALVAGVGSYGLELFRAVADIDTVYVPIGLGSGICGTMAARDALGLKTKVVGVVAENAAAYALSFAKKAAGLDQQRRHHRRRHGLPRAGQGRPRFHLSRVPSASSA